MQDERPSSSTSFYEIETSNGMYKNVVSSAKTSSDGTPLFQTPQILASLSQEAEEHLKIVGMFQHLAHYSKKMEQRMIELSKLKFKMDSICSKPKN
jgi:hypothetical protein